MKRFLCIFTLVVLCFSAAACGGDRGGDSGSSPDGGYNEPPHDEYTVSQTSTLLGLSSTDALGRYFGPEDGFDADKKVGLFYFLWIGQHDQANAGVRGVAWDISKMTGDQIRGDDREVGVFHYWNEPLYGYYNSEDPWVFRKHLELFVMAGIDYLVFDVSNSYYYKTVCENIFPVAAEYAAQGWNIPKFIFYCYDKTKDTVTSVYNDFYDPQNPDLRKYDALWYREADNGKRNLEGKPWIFVKNSGTGDGTGGASQNYSECSGEIKDFFYTRELRWGSEKEDGEWLFPSDIDNPSVHEGMLSVSVAQHPSGAFSDSVLEADRRDSNRGRGWVWEYDQNGNRTTGTNISSNVYAGTNYTGEWEHAYALGDEVNNVFLSTWNEWVAQKQPKGKYGRTTNYFVDQFTPEFSRDIEMTNGLWGDNFYLQTVSAVRRFKALSSPYGRIVPRQAAIDINGDVSQWNGTVGFLDFTGETAPREYKSSNLVQHGNVPVTTYTNDTGRNDIKQINVTSDDKNIYFLIECVDDITPWGQDDRTWMNLFMEVEGAGSGWNNYQFVVNRTVNTVNGRPVTYLERLSSNGSSSKEEIVNMAVSGRYLALEIPRKSISADKQHFTVNFKVADHVTDYTDIMNYYVNGDSAPIGRLNYTYSV